MDNPFLSPQAALGKLPPRFQLVEPVAPPTLPPPPADYPSFLQQLQTAQGQESTGIPGLMAGARKRAFDEEQARKLQELETYGQFLGPIERLTMGLPNPNSEAGVQEILATILGGGIAGSGVGAAMNEGILPMLRGLGKTQTPSGTLGAFNPLPGPPSKAHRDYLEDFQHGRQNEGPLTEMEAREIHGETGLVPMPGRPANLTLNEEIPLSSARFTDDVMNVLQNPNAPSDIFRLQDAIDPQSTDLFERFPDLKLTALSLPRYRDQPYRAQYHPGDTPFEPAMIELVRPNYPMNSDFSTLGSSKLGGTLDHELTHKLQQRAGLSNFGTSPEAAPWQFPEMNLEAMLHYNVDPEFNPLETYGNYLKQAPEGIAISLARQDFLDALGKLPEDFIGDVFGLNRKVSPKEILKSVDHTTYLRNPAEFMARWGQRSTEGKKRMGTRGYGPFDYLPTDVDFSEAGGLSPSMQTELDALLIRALQPSGSKGPSASLR